MQSDPDAVTRLWVEQVHPTVEQARFVAEYTRQLESLTS